MTKFHSDEYIKFLRSIRPDNMGEFSKLLQRYVSLQFAAIIKIKNTFIMVRE